MATWSSGVGTIAASCTPHLARRQCGARRPAGDQATRGGGHMQLSEVDREDSPQEEALEPDLAIVDAHHHLWPSGYWIPYDLAAMRADLARGHRVEATVFVEC